MIDARTAVASGLIAAGRDPALRLVPQFITILDEYVERRYGTPAVLTA